jgi:predicted dehydrogenase
VFGRRSENMRSTTVAIVSAGGAGQAHFLRFVSRPEVHVKTVFDVNENNFHHLPFKAHRTKFTNDYNQIIGDDEVDVVSICSPDDTHFKYALDAVRARKHVLVEKPLVTSLEQCKKLQTAVLDPDYNKVFGVHHQMRYVPCFKNAQEIINKQGLGRPIIIEADYVHDMRERATLFDDWRVSQESVQKVVLGASSHTIDLMRWILNSEIKEVFSYASHIGWPEYPDIDTVTTLLKFDNGTIGKAMSSIASQRPQLNSLNIYATEGSINNNLLINKRGFKSFICNKRPGIKRSILRWILTRSPMRDGPIQNYPYSVYEHDVACKALVDEFIHCINTGLDFPVSFSEGAYTTQACLASIESYETGKPIKINRAF